MSKVTQAERILAYMREHPEGITPITALEEFGCFRLGARIYDLRREGHQITAETHGTMTGKSVARYRLTGITQTPRTVESKEEVKTPQSTMKVREWVCGQCGAPSAYLHPTLLGEGFQYGVGKCPKHGNGIIMAVHRDVTAVWVTAGGAE